jgi:transcriptional regulator with XRE-family HTH domain
MGIGAIMKGCRLRKRFSQEQMAFELNLDQATISRIENDRQEPSLSIVTEWAKVTQSNEVLVAYLFGVDGVVIMQHIISENYAEARVQ